MAEQIEKPESSLRNNIMIVFVLAVILFGASITAMSHHILRRALLNSAVPAGSVQVIGRQFTQMLTGFTIAGTMVAIFIAALLSRTITEPIRRLLIGVAKLTSGHLSTQIDVAGDDELGRLATAFNDMASKLMLSHHHLETTVAERTAELTQANHRLQTEITERWSAEEAVRQSEQRLQDILHSILAGVFIIDPQTHIILDINDAAAKLIGLPKSEIVGKQCHRFICPTERGKCPITDLGQVVDNSEHVLLRTDGTTVPIIKSVTEATFQGHTYLTESFVEITEQKKVAAELQESLSLLEATLESTADGILVIDADGKIKSFNQQFKDLWCMPASMLESEDDDKALAFVLNQLSDPEAFLRKVKELYRQPETESFDVLQFADGRVVERYSKPQIIDDQIVGRVWSFRDITEKARNQQRQDKLLRQVEDINEELSHFAYVVSHDLKAPLRGIKLLTEWIRTDCGQRLDDESTENLRLLQTRVDRMHDLIEGVLQYSRVGRIKEEETEVDLGELVPNIMDAIAPPEHVRITIEGPLPTIRCEPTRITQVLQNLLTNAVKFMDKPTGEIQVACTDWKDAWVFRISDNGPGIEEKHFDRIFKIFQTLTPRDEFESTGVGLTLVKKIVELYGGKVWVESEVGQGATFFFTIPKQQARTEEQEALAGVDSPSDPVMVATDSHQPQDKPCRFDG
jgi:two-component system, LuxR family, sensor kinase FixL